MSPIVDGTRERGEPAVVALMHTSGGMCTASMISPRVGITARHCVGEYPNFDRILSASGFRVFVGDAIWTANEEYRVEEVRAAEGGSGWDPLYDSDFALFILTEDFNPDHGVKRWAFEPWPGFERNAPITAIGYGQTRFGDEMSAGAKYRRDGRIADVGPNTTWGLGDREFISQGENTCQGDSGGPILLDDVIVGIVSRGQEGCTGYGWMTRVSSFADMILEALEDTGGCVPTGFEACNTVDDDCWGGVNDGLDESCGCFDGGEPEDEVCDGVDNDCNEAIDDIESCACTDGGEPGEEVCDGVDNDCNGEIDEVCARLGEACGQDEDCASGLCAELDGEMVCTAHCVSGIDACPDDGWCDGEACEAGFCRADRGDGDLGDSCSSNEQCESGFCAAGASGSLRCARSCEHDVPSCYATEYCVVLSGSCGSCDDWRGSVEGRGFVEPCLDDEDCDSDFCFVDGDDDECGEGCTYRYCAESCGEDDECPDGSHCRDDICVRGPRSELGETCVDSGDCETGHCVDYDGVSRCVEDCDDEGLCEDGHDCVDGDVCWPMDELVGDPCDDEGEECGVDGSCLELDDDRFCANRCEDVGDCPSGLSCVPVGDEGFCIPSNIAVIVEAEAQDAGGCSCSSAGAKTRGGLLMVFVLLGFAATLRLARGSN